MEDIIIVALLFFSILVLAIVYSHLYRNRLTINNVNALNRRSRRSFVINAPTDDETIVSVEAENV